jgi:hypothetical protein
MQGATEIKIGAGHRAIPKLPTAVSDSYARLWFLADRRFVADQLCAITPSWTF